MNAFQKAKEMALKAINKDIQKSIAAIKSQHGIDAASLNMVKPSRYLLEDLEKIKNLNAFPNIDNFHQIYSLDVKYKAVFLKAHLQQAFPEAVIKVRIQRYSGGSAIDAWVKGPANPKEAALIGLMYQDDKGKSDPMSDYFAYDNYVHVMCENGGILDTNIMMLGKEMPAQ
jgi:hypothetical protein